MKLIFPSSFYKLDHFIVLHSRAGQSRAEQDRAEQSRAEQSRAEQSRAEQSRAEQSRAEQSIAWQSIERHCMAEQSTKLYGIRFVHSIIK